MKLSVDIDRCAPFTRSRGVDPVGSAGHHHSFVLVEVDLPWPSEITDAHELSGVTDVIAAAEERDGRLVRVLGIVPRGDRGDDQRRVIHYSRDVEGPFSTYEGRELVVAHGNEVETIAAMVSHPHDGRFTPVAGKDVLICTHGSRDVCCGGDGMRLHLAMADRLPGARVWRCSHTGGHRYAPTSITFPDGRFWAHLDETSLEQVVRRSATPADLRHHNRGSSAFASSHAQIAERELFERIGWSIRHGTQHIIEEHTDDAARGVVTIAHTDSNGSRTALRVTSEVSEEYPAMVCGDGADPTGKSFLEYRVVSVEEVNR